MMHYLMMFATYIVFDSVNQDTHPHEKRTIDVPDNTI